MTDASAGERPPIGYRRRPPRRVGDDCVLAARDLTVGYYGRPVVRDVQIELHRGEVVALLGANRAGKTTTLLGLAGAIPPIEGEVEWLGERVTKRATPQRLAAQGLGILAEDRAVFRQLTVAENLRVARSDVAAIALFPELEPLLKRKVGLLSGGEQQMVGHGPRPGSRSEGHACRRDVTSGWHRASSHD